MQRSGDKDKKVDELRPNDHGNLLRNRHGLETKDLLSPHVTNSTLPCMPVTADLQYYATYSPAQELSGTSNANSSYTRSPSPNARQDNHAAQEALDSSLTPPRRSHSLFRRINAAIKSKSSSSRSSDRRYSSLTDSTARKSHADPMYTVHPSVHPSRQSSLSVNPVSRFRRARDAEKAMREQSFPPEEWRVNEGTRHDQASVSCSRSDARGYSAGHNREDSHRRPEEPSKHTRMGYERNGNGSRSRGTPPSYRQTSEPIPHNRSAAMRASRSSVSHNTSGAEHTEKHQYVHAKRPVPGRSHTQPSRPVYSSESPSRMGKYGIYASPQPSSSQTSSTPHTLQENPIPRNVSGANERRYTPTNNRVEGWDVTIASAPSRTSTQSSSGSSSRPSNYARRPTQTRASISRSGGLTLVSDHPLVDRPLPSPPEKMEAKEAEEFAKSLTQRMSVLLEMDDVDFTSSQALASLAEESDAHCPSVSSSGTATPTGPLTSKQSIQPTDAGPDTPSENAASQSSPFGTFFTNAREMNNAFVRGTGSIWNNLFGKNKEKEKEKGKTKESGEARSDPADSSGSQTENVHKGSGHDSGESDMEGSRDIMLYSPLIPDADSIVEVATSEVVTLYSDNMEDAREHAYRAELRRRWADGRGFISFDALSTIEPVQEESAEPETTRVPREQADPSEGLSSLQDVDEIPRTNPRERVVWVPSPDKISVQVLWWGYRIYLPPPVLHVLNGRTDETAKRAALLTAALTWLLNNLPLASLPPVLAPAALLLRALVPLLGMIGSFIAWSWRATMSFDKGNGVVLSATWVLPIVLVPGTWDNNEEVPPGSIVPPSATGVDSTETGPE